MEDTPVLKGADRSKLRGLAMRRGDGATLGKGGLADGFVSNVDNLLKREQLVKVRLLIDDRAERARMLDGLADRLGAEVVGRTGKTGLLYRRNPELPSLLR
ncbi:MAG: YhbY family RNA-binding protein [Opitutales bacterium]|nr:YhbY family RNA-binding protein [Opitutales bacterium]